MFRPRSKKTSKFSITGLCAGNSPVTSEFPSQRASNAENVSIWWYHYHDLSTSFPDRMITKFYIDRAPTVREKPGKSGNSEITLPALESQGIPHVLFKIREKSVNFVLSRQHQNNIRPRPDFRAAHLFPRSNGPFSSFLRAYFARCQFDGSSLRTVFTWHHFPNSLWYQCNFIAARPTPSTTTVRRRIWCL